MNTILNSRFSATAIFRIAEHVKHTSLFTASEAAEAEQALLRVLDDLPPDALLRIEFSNVRVSSEAARQLLRRALLRATTGELKDRFVVLGDLGDSCYNVEVMLEGEGLVAVELSDEEGPQLRGDVDPVVRATYQHLLSVSNATAGSVQSHFSLANISTATNRLTTLSKLGLARRIDHRPVSGGGREFVYAAVR
jgi:hypothetical protein